MKNVIDKVTDPVPRRTTKKECVIFYLPSGVYLRRAAPCPSWHIIVSNFSRPESRGPRSNIHNCLRLPSIRLMLRAQLRHRPLPRREEDWFKECSQPHSFTKRTGQTSLIIFVRRRKRANRVYVTIRGSNVTAVKQKTHETNAITRQ